MSPIQRFVPLGYALLLALASRPAVAQETRFEEEVPTAYRDVSSVGTKLPLSGYNNGVNVLIGFNFTLYGTTVDNLVVSTDGYLCFDGSLTPNNDTIPSTFPPNGLIAPFWSNLDPRPNQAAAVYMQKGGSAPNRFFVIQWTGYAFQNDPAANLNFQVVIFEGTNEVQFQYGVMQNGDGTTGGQASGSAATIGVKSSDGTRGVAAFYNQQGAIHGRGFAFSANGYAVPEGRKLGDIDGDGQVTILDQSRLVEVGNPLYRPFSAAELLMADISPNATPLAITGDGLVNLPDRDLMSQVILKRAQLGPYLAGGTPNPMTIGSALTLQGSNFDASSGPANTVIFSGAGGTPIFSTAQSVNSAGSELTVTVPPLARRGPIFVLAHNQLSNPRNVDVQGIPSILSANPNPGIQGQGMTLYGVQFPQTVADALVTVNGISAIVSSVTPAANPDQKDQIQLLYVPTGFTPGNVPVVVSYASTGSTSEPFNMNIGVLPIAAIITPASQDAVAAVESIVGTAYSPLPLTYTLDLAPLPTMEFSPIGSGTAAVTSGVLGTLDPTMSINGFYVLRLTVTDSLGLQATAKALVSFQGFLKIGNFTMTFKDLTLRESGVPITIYRNYDTKDKFSHDFGFKWKIQVQTLQVQTDGNYNVILSYPDGRRVEWLFTPIPLNQFDRFYTANFTSQDPSDRNGLDFETPALEGIPGNHSLFSDDNGNFFWYPDALPFRPLVYDVTLVDGTVLRVGIRDDLEQIVKPDGNTVTFTHNGIIHSNGASVTYARDVFDRITTITDPSGNVLQYEYDRNGDLTQQTDQNGNTTTFTYLSGHFLQNWINPNGIRAYRNDYDDAGRLIATTDASGHKRVFVNDMAANRQVVYDRLGNPTVTEYDALGRATKIIYSDGGFTAYTYDDKNNILSRTDPDGGTWTFQYDKHGNQIQRTDPLNHTYSFTYDANSHILTATDPENFTTTNVFDAAGHLTQVLDANGGTTTWVYDNAGNLASFTDATNQTATFQNDGRGNRLQRQLPNGYLQTFTYDANNNLTSGTEVIVPAGQVTPVLSTKTYSYTPANQLASVLYPEGRQVDYTYNGSGKLLALNDSAKGNTSYAYDDRNNLNVITRPTGYVNQKTYDDNNNLVAIDDETGHKQATLDARGNVTAVQFPDGRSLSNGFDLVGRITSQTDALGNNTQYVYDVAGHCTRRIDPDGNVTKYTYDNRGLITSKTDGDGRAWQFQHDGVGNLVQTTLPDGRKETVQRDAVGRVTQKTDRNGRVITYAYDPTQSMQRDGITVPLGKTLFQYNARGQTTQRTDGNGNSYGFTYDASTARRLIRTLPMGQQETTNWDYDGHPLTVKNFNGDVINMTYQHDRLTFRQSPTFLEKLYYTNWNLLSQIEDQNGTTIFTQDANGRLQKRTEPDGRFLTYAYDANSRVLSVATPANVTSATYDYRGRWKSITDPSGGTTAYGWTAGGLLSSIQYPNGVAMVISADNGGRPQRLTFTGPQGAIAGYTYSYGTDGNVSGVVEDSGRQVAYTYDAQSRLISETATIAGISTVVAFTYDATGNRLTRSVTRSDGTAQNVTYSYDANDRLLLEAVQDTSSIAPAASYAIYYAYDQAGNMLGRQDPNGTTICTYDTLGRLTSASVASTTTNTSIQYAYDHFGNRIQETRDGDVTKHLVDSNRPFSESVLDTDVNGSVRRIYTFADRPISMTDASGNTYYYLLDAQRSVRFVTDASGNVVNSYTYGAYGTAVAVSESVPNVLRYAGEALDPALDLYFLRSRYLDPRVGRFVTPDTFEGTQDDPTTYNRYAYASGNPANRIDPAGTQDFDLCWVISQEVPDAIAATDQQDQDVRCSAAQASQMLDTIARVTQSNGDPWLYSNTDMEADDKSTAMMGLAGEYTQPIASPPEPPGPPVVGNLQSYEGVDQAVVRPGPAVLMGFVQPGSPTDVEDQSLASASAQVALAADEAVYGVPVSQPSSESANAQVQAIQQWLNDPSRSALFTNIILGQPQVDYYGNQVGVNSPGVQFDIVQIHVHVCVNLVVAQDEDTTARIIRNDPATVAIEISSSDDVVNTLSSQLGDLSAGGTPVTVEAPGGPPVPQPTQIGHDPVQEPFYNNTVLGIGVCAPTGEFMLQRTDFKVPGVGMDFMLQRTYRSRLQDSPYYDFPMGYGWTLSFDERLILDPASNMLMLDKDGRVVDQYKSSTDNTVPPQPVGPNATTSQFLVGKTFTPPVWKPDAIFVSQSAVVPYAPVTAQGLFDNSVTEDNELSLYNSTVMKNPSLGIPPNTQDNLPRGYALLTIRSGEPIFQATELNGCFVHQPNGTTKTYNQFRRLVGITDPSGNTIQIIRDQATQLIMRIVDTTGRQYDFSYRGFKDPSTGNVSRYMVDTITDTVGNQYVHYLYDPVTFDLLGVMNSPTPLVATPATALSTVQTQNPVVRREYYVYANAGPAANAVTGFPNGSTGLYYADVELQHNMTNILSPNEVDRVLSGNASSQPPTPWLTNHYTTGSGGSPEFFGATTTNNRTYTYDKVGLQYLAAVDSKTAAQMGVSQSPGGLFKFNYPMIPNTGVAANAPYATLTFTDPTSNKYQYTFNPAGNALQVMDPESNTTIYTYIETGSGLLLAVKHPDGRIVTNIYDTFALLPYQRHNLVCQYTQPGVPLTQPGEPTQPPQAPTVVTWMKYEPIYNRVGRIIQARGIAPLGNTLLNPTAQSMLSNLATLTHQGVPYSEPTVFGTLINSSPPVTVPTTANAFETVNVFDYQQLSDISNDWKAVVALYFPAPTLPGASTISLTAAGGTLSTAVQTAQQATQGNARLFYTDKNAARAILLNAANFNTLFPDFKILNQNLNGSDLVGNGSNALAQAHGNIVATLKPFVMLDPVNDADEIARLTSASVGPNDGWHPDTNIEQPIVRMQWDTSANMTTSIDAEGNVTRYNYNSLDGFYPTYPDTSIPSSYPGLLASVTYDAPRISQAATRTSRYNEEQISTTVAYDRYGNVASLVDGRGVETRRVYNSAGGMLLELEAWTVPAVISTFTYQYQTLMDYDDNGNIARRRRTKVDAQPGTYYETVYRYDLLNQLGSESVRFTAPSGSDPMGPGWLLTTHQYSPSQKEILLTDPLGNVVMTNYNDLNLPSAQIKAPGTIYEMKTEMLYDPCWRLYNVRTHGSSVPGSPTNETEYDKYVVHDGLGRKYSSYFANDPAGAEEHHLYDPDSNVIDTTSYGVAMVGAAPETLAHDVIAIDALNRTRSVTSDVDASATIKVVTEYDRNGRVIATKDANGNTRTFFFDGMGRVRRMTDPAGNTTDRYFDHSGNPIREMVTERVSTNAGTATETFNTWTAFDSVNRPVRIVNNAGETIYVAHDSLGQVLMRWDARGTPVTATDSDRYQIQSDPQQDPTSDTSIDPFAGTSPGSIQLASGNSMNTKGNEVDLQYDLAGRLTDEIYLLASQPGAITLHRAYYANGLLQAQSDGRGDATTYAFDPANRLMQTTFADGTSGTYKYEGRGLLVVTTDPNGTTVWRDYDTAGRLSDVLLNKAAAGVVGVNRQSFFYDGLSRVYHSFDDNGVPILETVDRQFDRLSRVTNESSIIDNPGARAATLNYDNNGNLVSLQYPSGRTYLRPHDQLDRLTDIGIGPQLVLTPLVHYSYHGASRPSQRIHTGTSLVAYDPLGQKSFDPVQRLKVVQQQAPAGNVFLDHRYLYDRSGDRTTEVRANAGEQGLSDKFGFDSVRWLRNAQFDVQDPSVAMAAGVSPVATASPAVNRGLLSRNLNFDPVGSRTSVTSVANDPANTTTTVAYSPNAIAEYASVGTQTYQYDKNGNLLSDGVRQFSYDMLNRLVYATTATTDQTSQTGYHYDAFGVRRSSTITHTWVFTVQGGTSSIGSLAVTSGALTLSMRSDIDNNGVPSNGDVLNVTQLTLATTVGNLTLSQPILLGVNVGTSTISLNAPNQAFSGGQPSIASAVGSALLAGNGGTLTITGTFTGSGGVTESVTLTATRANPLTPNKTVVFTYAGGQCIEELYLVGPRAGSGGLRELVHGDRVDEIPFVGVYQSTSAPYVQTGAFYLHPNAIGSTVAAVAVTSGLLDRIAYDEYGVAYFQDAGIHASIGCDYLFHGHRLEEEDGLYYWRARFYDPTLGRFIQRDPLGFWGDPAEFGNPYTFVANNPTSLIDPSGQIIPLLIVAGAAIYAAVDFGVQYHTTGGFKYGDFDVRELGKQAGKGAIVGAVVGLTAGSISAGLARVAAAGEAEGGGGLIAQTLVRLGVSQSTAATLEVAGSATFDAYMEVSNAQDTVSDLEDLFGLSDDDSVDMTCFLAKTLVLTASGPRPIEEIKPGDWVVARSDFDGSGLGYRQVLAAFHNTTNRFYEVTIGDVGSTTAVMRGAAREVAPPSRDREETPEPPSQTQTIRVSADHRWYVPERGWIATDELRTGEHLVDLSGAHHAIIAVELRAAKADIFNLEIRGHHTYFVSGREGAPAVWVHNSSLINRMRAAVGRFSNAQIDNRLYAGIASARRVSRARLGRNFASALVEIEGVGSRVITRENWTATFARARGLVGNLHSEEVIGLEVQRLRGLYQGRSVVIKQLLSERIPCGGRCSEVLRDLMEEGGGVGFFTDKRKGAAMSALQQIYGR
jgi:RHS repeat-associated protein